MFGKPTTEIASTVSSARARLRVKVIAALGVIGFLSLSLLLGASTTRHFDGLEVEGTAKFQR